MVNSHVRRSILPIIMSILLATVSLSSCTSSETSDTRLILTGSSTVAPLAAEIGKRFESLHPNTRVDVQSGGSSRGIADVRSALSTIGMVSRPLKDGENDLHAVAIARDGICVILHRDNPIALLTEQQIIDVYTGKITRWMQVDPTIEEGTVITVVNKAEGRSTLELFLKYFRLENADIKAHVIIGENQQGIKTVAGNPNAIGYVSIGSAEYAATHGTPITLLPLNGVAATTGNVLNGSYPLSRPLNLVTSTIPTGLAREFIDFAGSETVHDIVREQYFVPLAP